MSYKTALVYVLGVPYHVDRQYEYYLPTDLAESAAVGMQVMVPFGKANRKMSAVIFGFSEQEDIDRYKPVLSLRDDFLLSEELLKLAVFVKEQTFCTVGDAIRAMLPPAALMLVDKSYYPLKGASEVGALNLNVQTVYGEILAHPGITFEKLRASFGEGVDKILRKLIFDGYIEQKATLRSGGNIRYDELIYLTNKAAEEGALASVKGAKQRELLAYLADNTPAALSELKKILKITSAQVKSLTERGFIRTEKIELARMPYQTEASKVKPIELSDEQRSAAEALGELIDSGAPKAALLHGVTGSGKTLVIKEAIDRVIASGRQVILLVPEIALTPQTVSIFCAYYGKQVAVLHSSLSQGERYDAWRKIRAGEVSLCIGTRSAIFAPFPKLGMIVLDEEHEHTYKSEQSPRYHARDIARFRCNYHKALMLLASATPSVESYYKAQKGNYSLIELQNRYHSAKLPETVICDMKVDPLNSAPERPVIGSILRDGIARALDEGKQAILFVNRRGYHSFASCTLCGEVLRCPHCSVSLTYHAGRRQRDSRYLCCHYCGYRQTLPPKCPSCGGDKDAFRFMGFGTQKAEAELAELFPNARVLRMDADTTAAKFSYDILLDRFRGGEADILIGTQMVTKGHDFPNVTLSGVLMADNSLYLDDFRASEKTFALMTQVIGRAGRGDSPGVAVVQTYSPDHPVLQLSAMQDYRQFYKNEIALRKALTFPPFCDLALIQLSCADEAMLQNALTALTLRLRQMLEGDWKDVSMILFGPFDAPVYKLNEVYRMRLIVKCRANARTRALLSSLLAEHSQKYAKKITCVIDMNPSSI